MLAGALFYFRMANMVPRFFSILGLFLGSTSWLAAQDPGPSLPFRLLPIPEPIYAHWPSLPRGEGLMLERVDADSVVYKGGLRQWDLLLRVNDKAVSGSKEGVAFLNKLLESAPGGSRIALLRGGEAMSLTFALPSETAAEEKGVVKPQGPPTVSVQAAPMGGDKLQVTVFYYPEDSSKLRKVICNGTLKEIERQIHKGARLNHMSEEVLDLVATALSRLQELQPLMNPKEEKK